MNKKGFISMVIAGLMIFCMAAVASADVVTLKAKVPEGKTLKAYRFTVKYDADKVKVADVKGVKDSGFMSTVNANTPGTIIANGINVDGVEGKGKKVSLIEITVDGIAKGADFSVTVDDFGSNDERFEADAEPVIE